MHISWCCGLKTENVLTSQLWFNNTCLWRSEEKNLMFYPNPEYTKLHLYSQSATKCLVTGSHNGEKKSGGNGIQKYFPKEDWFFCKLWPFEKTNGHWANPWSGRPGFLCFPWLKPSCVRVSVLQVGIANCQPRSVSNVKNDPHWMLCRKGSKVQ